MRTEDVHSLEMLLLGFGEDGMWTEDVHSSRMLLFGFEMCTDDIHSLSN